MSFLNTLAKQLIGYAAARSLDWVGVCQGFRSHPEGGVKMPSSRFAPRCIREKALQKSKTSLA
jgi:hypothetical protein